MSFLAHAFSACAIPFLTWLADLSAANTNAQRYHLARPVPDPLTDQFRLLAWTSSISNPTSKRLQHAWG